MPTTPEVALRTLLEGNARFVAGRRHHPHQDADRRTEIAPAQRPFAALFGCSDSRMAAEIIFDRGLGDLFVVRTAGHVVGPEVLGSIEYAVEALDVPLIVVLGHDSCGAVGAALEAMTSGSFPRGAIRDVVERVMLSLVGLRSGPGDAGWAAGVPVAAGRVIDEHVRYTVDLLLRRSSLTTDRLARRTCGVVGLRYHLVDGTVHEVVRHGV
jgi:carbonic anhydrase